MMLINILLIHFMQFGMSAVEVSFVFCVFEVTYTFGNILSGFVKVASYHDLKSLKYCIPFLLCSLSIERCVCDCIWTDSGSHW